MLYDTKWDETKSSAPKFGKRWHSLSRLDIRPVLWSLRNRPEEWERGYCTINHKPSKHEFWVANGFWFYSLYRADCSCRQDTEGKFSFIQKAQFSMALRAWAKHERSERQIRMAEINKQFAAHFLPTS